MHSLHTPVMQNGHMHGIEYGASLQSDDDRHYNDAFTLTHRGPARQFSNCPLIIPFPPLIPLHLNENANAVAFPSRQ